MLLADRNPDHLACFKEDKEAVFFSSSEELVDKVKFYLRNESLRKEVAAAGHKRCMESGYSNHDRIRIMLEEVMSHVSDIG
jgi:spore maturation protein CgeB